jgi:hypothetical protein
MNDSLLHAFLTDYRTYVATGIGLVGVALSSRRVLERWPFCGRLPAARVCLALPFLIFLCAFFFGGVPFDWNGEFAGGILCAFGFVLSIHLLRFRNWFHRGVGLLFVIFYAFLIYDTARAWIARGNNGHPFR